MGNNVKWIKLSTDIFDNPKIQIIEEMKNGQEIILTWIKLLTLAGKLNNSGKILIKKPEKISEKNAENFYKKTIAKMIKISPKKLENFLTIFEEFEMIFYDEKNVISISNWCRYQSEEKLEKIRQQTQKRVARHRENSDKTDDEKERYNSVTNSVTDSVTDENSEKERKERTKEKKEYKNIEVVEVERCNANFDGNGGGENDKIFKLGGDLGQGVVYLTQNQFNDLLNRLDIDVFNRYIKKLADFIISKNADVSNHYETILKWVSEDTEVRSA